MTLGQAVHWILPSTRGALPVPTMSFHTGDASRHSSRPPEERRRVYLKNAPPPPKLGVSVSGRWQASEPRNENADALSVGATS